MIKTLNLAYKQIYKTYCELPFIIYKKKYLIPQAPLKPRLNNFIINSNPLLAISQSYPQLLTETLRLKNSPECTPELTKIYKDRYLKDLDQFTSRKEEYIEKYVKPLKYPGQGIKPEIEYFNSHKEQIMNEIKLQGRKYNMKMDVYDRYQRLPQSEKQKYEEIIQQKLKQRLINFANAQRKYGLPQFNAPLTKQIFLNERYDGQSSQQALAAYKALSVNQKKKYLNIRKELKQQHSQKFKQFLAQRKLTLEQFNYIKQACQKFNEICRQISRNKRKLTLEQDDEIQPDSSILIQPSKNQITQQSHKIDPTQKRQTKQLQTQKFEQINLQQIETLQKPISSQFSEPQYDNLDWNEEESMNILAEKMKSKIRQK